MRRTNRDSLAFGINLGSFFPADAKAIATSYDCKYTETSASLNHNVDELLVGILTQIRLKLAEKTGARYIKRKSRLGQALKASSAGGADSNPVTRRKSAGVRVKGILDKVRRVSEELILKFFLNLS